MAFVDTYAPLILARNYNDNIDIVEKIKEYVIKAGCHEEASDTIDEFIHYGMSDAFLNRDHKGKYKKLNDILINDVLHMMNNIPNMFEGDNINIIAECQDIFLFPLFLDKWIRNKQVYKPDKDFTNALLSTDKCEFTKDMIEHLPCNNIYIDMLDCEMFKPIDGFFLNVESYDDMVQVAIYLLQKNKEDVVFFSYYAHAMYDDNGIARIDVDKMVNSDIDRNIDFYMMPILNNTLENTDYKLNRAHMSIFGLLLIAYLSSKEPQIEENKITKQTYRKPSSTSTVKNKFSEIQMWDVGVTYGNSYRNTMKQLNSGNKGFMVSNRKSPIPHFRRAHWQRYWVGKGRTKCVNKWIGPEFINGSMAKDININKIN